jgi:hypothetical protein
MPQPQLKFSVDAESVRLSVMRLAASFDFVVLSRRDATPQNKFQSGVADLLHFANPGKLRKSSGTGTR